MPRFRTYRRRAEKPLRVWLRRAMIAGELLTVVAVTAALLFKFYEFTRVSNQFQVRSVEIEGLDILHEDQILQASGITMRDNVMYFDAASTKRRVEELPYVKSCSVGLIFPDTIVLKVREREPYAALMVNSRAYEIDADRVVLREYGSAELPPAPYITNVANLDFVAVGQHLEQRALVAALDVWAAYSGADIANSLTVSELAAWNEDDIRMYCDEVPFEIRWGRSDFRTQVKRLDVLWDAKHASLECFEYLDLRFDQDLVCK